MCMSIALMLRADTHSFLSSQLCKVNTELEALHGKQYSASKVYVVFEKEEGQRACLNALTTGYIPALLESSRKVNHENLQFHHRLVWTRASHQREAHRFSALSLAVRALPPCQRRSSSEERQGLTMQELFVVLVHAAYIFCCMQQITDDLKFRGTNVLKVEEAAEPGEVNWSNQSVSITRRILELVCTMTLTFILVAGSAVGIWLTSLVDPAFAAIFISVSNSILPTVMKVRSLSVLRTASSSVIVVLHLPQHVNFVL